MDSEAGAVSGASLSCSSSENLLRKHRLREIMRDPFKFRLFQEYCRKKFCTESLEFITAVDNFRTLSATEDIVAQAKNVFDEFFSTTSPKEINVDHRIKELVTQKMEMPDTSLFDEAYESICAMLEQDTVRKFLGSEFFKKADSRVLRVVADYRATGVFSWSELSVTRGQILKFLSLEDKSQTMAKQKRLNMMSELGKGGPRAIAELVSLASNAAQGAAIITPPTGTLAAEPDFWVEVVAYREPSTSDAAATAEVGWVPHRVVEEVPIEGRKEGFLSRLIDKQSSTDNPTPTPAPIPPMSEKMKRIFGSFLVREGQLVSSLKGPKKKKILLSLERMQSTRLLAGFTDKAEEITRLESITALMRDPENGVDSRHAPQLASSSSSATSASNFVQFSGSKAISWMLKHSIANTRTEGRRIGQRLMDCNLIYAVDANSRQPFLDGNYIYRLREPKYVQIAAKMMDPVVGVEVRDRKYKGKPYNKSFLGNEATTWLSRFLKIEPSAAIAIGNTILEQGLIFNATDPARGGFVDEPIPFRFRTLKIKVDPALLKLALEMSDPTGGVHVSDEGWFRGREAVDWLVSHVAALTRDKAIKVGIRLLDAELIASPKGRQFEDSSEKYGFVTENIQAWREYCHDPEVQEFLRQMTDTTNKPEPTTGSPRRPRVRAAEAVSSRDDTHVLADSGELSVSTHRSKSLSPRPSRKMKVEVSTSTSTVCADERKVADEKRAVSPPPISTTPALQPTGLQSTLSSMSETSEVHDKFVASLLDTIQQQALVIQQQQRELDALQTKIEQQQREIVKLAALLVGMPASKSADGRVE